MKVDSKFQIIYYAVTALTAAPHGPHTPTNNSLLIHLQISIVISLVSIEIHSKSRDTGVKVNNMAEIF